MTKLGASYPHGTHLWKAFPEGAPNFYNDHFFWIWVPFSPAGVPFSLLWVVF